LFTIDRVSESTSAGVTYVSILLFKRTPLNYLTSFLFFPGTPVVDLEEVFFGFYLGFVCSVSFLA